MQVMTATSDALARYLDLASNEMKLTAENMANVDTPGYNNLIADFASGTVGATASTDVGVLTAALNNVSQQQAVLGSSLSRLETASTYAQADATNRTAAASALVAADPATVATQLSSAETQNQALMSVISTVEKQSLFDYMRN